MLTKYCKFWYSIVRTLQHLDKTELDSFDIYGCIGLVCIFKFTINVDVYSFPISSYDSVCINVNLDAS